MVDNSWFFDAWHFAFHFKAALTVNTMLTSFNFIASSTEIFVIFVSMLWRPCTNVFFGIAVLKSVAKALNVSRYYRCVCE